MELTYFMYALQCKILYRFAHSVKDWMLVLDLRASFGVNLILLKSIMNDPVGPQ